MIIPISAEYDGRLLRSYLKLTLGLSTAVLSKLKNHERGILVNGERVTVRYVLREGEFGYVPKPYDLTIPENTEYAEYLSSQTESTLQSTAATPIQIGFLVVLCLLVPLLSALIIKSSKSPYVDPDDE